MSSISGATPHSTPVTTRKPSQPPRSRNPEPRQDRDSDRHPYRARPGGSSTGLRRPHAVQPALQPQTAHPRREERPRTRIRSPRPAPARESNPTPGVAYPSIPTATTRGPLRTTPPRLRATGPMDEPTSSACAAGTAQRGSCREGPWLRSRSWVFRAPRSTSRRWSPGAGCAVATLQPKARGRNHDPRCREPSR